MKNATMLISALKAPEDEFKDRENIESALRESQNQYQQLIDELPEGYTEYDLKGNLIGFNKAMLAMCTRTMEELKNLPYKEFMDPETAARTAQAYNEVYRTGIPKRGFVHDVIRKDGSRKTFEGSILLKKVNGKVVGFRGIWQDITARKKTEDELANHRGRLEAIFGSVKEGIIAVDANGRITDVNRAVETICGVPAGNIIGKAFAETQALCGKTCHTILTQTLSKETEIRECQIGCHRNDRPQQTIVINSSPLVGANGQSMGAVLVIRDITELLGLEKELRGRYKFQNLIGKCKRMQEVYDLLENLANHETTVLITGKSGTGKELVAKALHYAGERAHKPFVKVNCSALTESLLESELFGHVKGAFTGAIKDRPGRFQMADGGTILLDEIGDLSPLIQLKLLRVLQEKEFERVGESITQKVDVRVITSTNKDLKEKVQRGEFREDLYYRLKVMEITLPCLRERLEDLPLLIDHFCQLFNVRFKKKIDGVSSEVLARFMNYAWPGNVRELEHVLEHAFVLCNGRVIAMEHLPAEIRDVDGREHPSAQGGRPKQAYAAQEVLAALEKCRWNKTKAALLLGVDRRTIHRKIKQFQLLET
ncbi:MAG: sigma 54-interacting transcriptional regulator [Desulfobacteraceae bacterium]|nr:sigma 54-interacting transcriptional regulator [Desulfobacteraceae bacterium]